MKNKPVWQFINECLQNQTRVALLAVVESFGSSPGKAGFKMAVAANGERRGTIGGGVMEVNWVERTLKSLREGNSAPVVRRVFHSHESLFEQSGLICSGSQTILAMQIDASVTSVVGEIVRMYNEKTFGRLRIESRGISFELKQRHDDDFTFAYKSESDWLYKENSGVLDTVYIIGGGHVGLALSRIMATLDFHVVIIDERGDVETFVKNSFAHAKHSMRFENLGEVISAGERGYAAVVTTAYKRDEVALKSIINTNLKYIGLMGSEAKTKQIFSDLRAEGIADEQLKNIHAPIGIPIASHTPEEIAISIAAEIIQAKNEHTS